MSVTTIPSAGITDATIATADIADNAVTAAKAGFDPGKIGQMISATHSTSLSTTATSRVATGLTATITPSASSSKILVLMTMAVAVNRANAEIYLQYALQRGGSDIWDTTGVQPWGAYMGGTNHVYLTGQINLTYVDSPSTTSATTYSITGCQNGGGTAAFNAHNAPSTMQLLEVLA